MPYRGGKLLWIYNLQTKSRIADIDLQSIPSLLQGKEGIYNAGFYDDSNLLISYKNQIIIYNWQTPKTNITNTNAGHSFSAYSKGIVLSPNRQFFLAQYMSNEKIQNVQESKSLKEFYPLSIYSFKSNKLLGLPLAKESQFNSKLLGQPIVSFDYRTAANTGFITISPDPVIYKFTIMDGLPQYTASISFKHPFFDSLISVPRLTEYYDIPKVTTLNPVIQSLLINNNKLFLSIQMGLSEKDFLKMNDYTLSMPERANLYGKMRQTQVLIFDLQSYQYQFLKQNNDLEGLSLHLQKDLFLARSKLALHYGADSLWLYVLQVKNIK
jgi:hypothetical protein